MNLKQKIVIVDYGVGNVRSIYNSVRGLGYSSVKVSSDKNDIGAAVSLILPGVGAFGEAMRNLELSGLIPLLNERVLQNKKPIFGICLGMQLLSKGSEENGWHTGLDWIEGRVEALKVPHPFVVPHVGWNNISVSAAAPLFTGVPENAHFYFDHGYHFCAPEAHVAATCSYGREITAAVQRGNIFGVQFHPEKSQNNGLRIFRNFFNYAEQC